MDQATDIAAAQDVVWTVTFTNGTYRFQCDAHSTSMRGRFTVGTVAASNVLKASVGPKRTITLQPKTVAAGPARITVVDRSRTDNFHLVGPGEVGQAQALAQLAHGHVLLDRGIRPS